MYVEGFQFESNPSQKIPQFSRFPDGWLLDVGGGSMDGQKAPLLCGA